MKKLLLLFLTLALALGAFAQPAIGIYGTVTELGTGNPIPNHTVYIVDDSSLSPPNFFYTSVLQTDANGFYIDTISIPGNVAMRFFVYTFDCQNQYHFRTVDVFANGTLSGVPANFSLCRNTPPNCQSSFTAQPDSSGFTYSFSGSSNTNVVSWTWNFGDGSSGTGQYPTHSYSQNGNYIVCLTTTDANSCVSTFCDTVVVSGGNPSNCSVTFQAYPDTTMPGKVYFTGIASNAVNPTWTWTFGDGGSSTVQYPIHTYNSTGWFQVCVSIQDAGGCRASYCDSVYIAPSGPLPCQASFTYSLNGLLASFVGQANASGPVSSWSWNFGSGYVNAGQIATTAFAAPGTYPVCLAIATQSGCTDTFCTQVNVPAPNYAIYGQVHTGNQFADYGTVWLITYDSTSNLLSAVDSTSIDSLGYYFFSRINPGSYTVKAALDSTSASYANYLPTYLGDTLFWHGANFVNVNGSLWGQDIHLVAGNNPGGPGFIGGNVLQGANKQDPGDPIGDMPILLLDMSDQAIAYTYSDANGDFGFSNLAYGTYKVYAEAINRWTNPAIVTLSAANASVNGISIEVNSNSVSTTAIAPENFQFLDGPLGLYPNPAGEETRLELLLKQPGQLEVVIRNTLGQALRRQQQAAGQGPNELLLDLNGLPAGMYLVQVSVNREETVTAKLVKY